MPKHWLYFIALVLPLTIRVLTLNTVWFGWLWSFLQTDMSQTLDALRAQPLFITLVGGWPLPVFTVTMFAYWITDTNSYDDMGDQFLLLPIFYLPFTVIGDMLVTREFHPENFYIHPLIILPVGYMYVFIWALFIRLLDKLRLVL